MLKKQKGFSLVELLVILSFIGVFTAMVVNFNMRNKNRWALRDLAREITSTYYQAKQQASRENASVRLDIGADGYAFYRANAGAWEVVKSETFYEQVSASAIANFKINPMGFILHPDILNNTILGTQTITLIAPRGALNDSMTITIYPYGGLRVDKDFK